VLEYALADNELRKVVEPMLRMMLKVDS
jgi:hypothetical protein